MVHRVKIRKAHYLTEQEETIEKLHKLFKKEDKADPFGDRNYVEETNRIYGLLKEGVGDFTDPTDRAIYDIVADIFNAHKPEWRKKWLK